MTKCPMCGKEEEDEGNINTKISPGEILIISRKGDSFLVAENKDNNICIRTVKIEEIEDK